MLIHINLCYKTWFNKGESHLLLTFQGIYVFNYFHNKSYDKKQFHNYKVPFSSYFRGKLEDVTIDDRNKKDFIDGLHDGFPIGMGYFAVAFSLGFIARNAGLTPIDGYIASFLNHASAGEYALYTSIADFATYAELALITFIVNARYLLMSCSLSQRFDPNAPFFHRLLVGFGITDEIFGVSIARPGYLSPHHFYGAMLMSIPLWGLGNSLGIWLGDLLPDNITSALSVALYGMFVAIIIPPSMKDKVIAVAVIASFALSYWASVAPYLSELSTGTRTILLTVAIAAIAAIVKPVKESEINQEGEPKQ